jgi:hypothetical protein
VLDFKRGSGLIGSADEPQHVNQPHGIGTVNAADSGRELC